MNDTIIYNYWCINDDCVQQSLPYLRIEKEETDESIEICPKCNMELKQMGVSTGLSGIGGNYNYK